MMDTAKTDHFPTCYCDLWNSKPSVLEKQGIPRGYCSLCDVAGCEKPGHLRADPVGPFSQGLCEEHYAGMLKGVPMRRLMQTLVYLVFYAIVAVVVWWLGRITLAGLFA